MLCQTLIVIVSIVRVLSLENILEPSTVFEDRNLIVPIDIPLLHYFMILHMANTEYIGLNKVDYW